MTNGPQATPALSFLMVAVPLLSAGLGAFVGSWFAMRREKKLHVLRVRTELYRDAVLPFVGFLVSIPAGRSPDLEEFERERLKAYAALALFAPQEVLSAYDRLVDYFFDCTDGKATYSWPRVRELGTHALNKARADLGIKGEIRYFGAR